jgi:hypothetical protein
MVVVAPGASGSVSLTVKTFALHDKETGGMVTG